MKISQCFLGSKDGSKFWWKNIENWGSPENDFCWVFSFLVFGYWVVQKIVFFVFSQWKFLRLVLGCVGLIDAKGIDVAQPKWSWGCPTLKRPKAFIWLWGITYFCTMGGFFRILEKTSSELICTRLYFNQSQQINLFQLMNYFVIGLNCCRMSKRKQTGFLADWRTLAHTCVS